MRCFWTTSREEMCVSTKQLSCNVSDFFYIYFVIFVVVLFLRLGYRCCDGAVLPLLIVDVLVVVVPRWTFLRAFFVVDICFAYAVRESMVG